MPASTLPDRGLRIGLDPIDRVFLMENHDQAYHVWRDAGARQRVLVHIDAHHDMWWAEDAKSITIANFISLALKNDIVSRVFWVVPDATWKTWKGRQAVRKHVAKISKSYPGGPTPVRLDEDEISTVVIGKPLKVCSLDSLPRIEGSVLLDIDVDFLVVPRVSHGEIETHEGLPWCWPDELLARLHRHAICVDLVTIVYSVEGGYTPLKWKYLGDELAVRLRDPGKAEAVLPMQLVREAARAADEGDIAGAVQKYRKAIGVSPEFPAPDYHLAHLCSDMGRIEAGQALYRHALAKDPSYRTAYSNEGFNYYWAGRFREAEREFRRTLALDPGHAFAHLGLGLIAARKKRWAEAEMALRKALSLNGNIVDVHRKLAEVLVKQGHYAEAVEAHEQSLKLAMAGHKPLGGLIATDGEQLRLLDSSHGYTYARLARLHARRGDLPRAIDAYRMSIGLGYDGVLLRIRLLHLYTKQRDWRNAGLQVWHVVRILPADLKKARRQFRGRLRTAIYGAYNILLERP